MPVAETETPAPSHPLPRAEVIGVVGGVGPYAGLDLLGKILGWVKESGGLELVP